MAFWCTPALADCGYPPNQYRGWVFDVSPDNDMKQNELYCRLSGACLTLHIDDRTYKRVRRVIVERQCGLVMHGAGSNMIELIISHPKWRSPINLLIADHGSAKEFLRCLEICRLKVPSQEGIRLHRERKRKKVMESDAEKALTDAGLGHLVGRLEDSGFGDFISLGSLSVNRLVDKLAVGVDDAAKLVTLLVNYYSGREGSTPGSQYVIPAATQAKDWRLWDAFALCELDNRDTIDERDLPKFLHDVSGMSCVSFPPTNEKSSLKWSELQYFPHHTDYSLSFGEIYTGLLELRENDVFLTDPEHIKPVQLAKFKHTEKGDVLFVQDDALRTLKSLQSAEVVVIGSIGLSGCNKGFVMNRLFGRQSGFSCADEGESEGIWMWVTPPVRGCSVLLLDGECFDRKYTRISLLDPLSGEVENSVDEEFEKEKAHKHVQLTAFMMMICSHLLISVKWPVNADQMEILRHVLEYVNFGTKASNPEDFGHHFPKATFLFHDAVDGEKGAEARADKLIDPFVIFDQWLAAFGDGDAIKDFISAAFPPNRRAVFRIPAPNISVQKSTQNRKSVVGSKVDWEMWEEYQEGNISEIDFSYLPLGYQASLAAIKRCVMANTAVRMFYDKAHNDFKPLPLAGLARVIDDTIQKLGAAAQDLFSKPVSNVGDALNYERCLWPTVWDESTGEAAIVITSSAVLRRGRYGVSSQNSANYRSTVLSSHATLFSNTSGMKLKGAAASPSEMRSRLFSPNKANLSRSGGKLEEALSDKGYDSRSSSVSVVNYQSKAKKGSKRSGEPYPFGGSVSNGGGEKWRRQFINNRKQDKEARQIATAISRRQNGEGTSMKAVVSTTKKSNVKSSVLKRDEQEVAVVGALETFKKKVKSFTSTLMGDPESESELSGKLAKIAPMIRKEVDAAISRERKLLESFYGDWRGDFEKLLKESETRREKLEKELTELKAEYLALSRAASGANSARSRHRQSPYTAGADSDEAIQVAAEADLHSSPGSRNERVAKSGVALFGGPDEEIGAETGAKTGTVLKVNRIAKNTAVIGEDAESSFVSMKLREFLDKYGNLAPIADSKKTDSSTMPTVAITGITVSLLDDVGVSPLEYSIDRSKYITLQPSALRKLDGASAMRESLKEARLSGHSVNSASTENPHLAPPLVAPDPEGSPFPTQNNGPSYSVLGSDVSFSQNVTGTSATFARDRASTFDVAGQETRRFFSPDSVVGDVPATKSTEYDMDGARKVSSDPLGGVDMEAIRDVDLSANLTAEVADFATVNDAVVSKRLRGSTKHNEFESDGDVATVNVSEEKNDEIEAVSGSYSDQREGSYSYSLSDDEKVMLSNGLKNVDDKKPRDRRKKSYRKPRKANEEDVSGGRSLSMDHEKSEVSRSSYTAVPTLPSSVSGVHEIVSVALASEDASHSAARSKPQHAKLEKAKKDMQSVTSFSSEGRGTAPNLPSSIGTPRADDLSMSEASRGPDDESHSASYSYSLSETKDGQLSVVDSKSTDRVKTNIEAAPARIGSASGPIVAVDNRLSTNAAQVSDDISAIYGDQLDETLPHHENPARSDSDSASYSYNLTDEETADTQNNVRPQQSESRDKSSKSHAAAADSDYSMISSGHPRPDLPEESELPQATAVDQSVAIDDADAENSDLSASYSYSLSTDGESDKTNSNGVPTKVNESQDLSPEGVDKSLFEAVRRKDVRLMRKLLSSGHANLKWHNKSFENWTALHAAVDQGDEELVGELLSAGANPNEVDGDGATSLHTCALKGNAAIARNLLKYSGDVNAKDTDGATPLHNAARFGHASVCTVLLQNGARCAVTDDSGWTPLHWAVASKRVDCVRVLLMRGADCNPLFPNAKGETAKDLALASKNDEIIDLISSHIAKRTV